MDNVTAAFNVLLINANKEEHSTENYPCDIRYCYRHPFDGNVFIIFFQRWIFFRANFIVCLLQFDVHHWDDRIKNAIDENMAHCYGIKRIKLDHYVGYCSPQLHIILSAMASHSDGIFRTGKILHFGKISEALYRLENNSPHLILNRRELTKFEWA